MRVVVDELKGNMINIDLGLQPSEIDRLIGLLEMLKSNHDQHFHISSNFDGACRVGEITFYVKEPNEPDDIHLLSRALSPGDIIPL